MVEIATVPCHMTTDTTRSNWMATLPINDDIQYYLTFLRGESRHLIDMLTAVSRVWHAKSKVKIEGLEQPVLEVMSLHHPKLPHLLVTHCEVNPAQTEVGVLLLELESCTNIRKPSDMELTDMTEDC